jgi:hypothetical protein
VDILKDKLTKKKNFMRVFTSTKEFGRMESIEEVDNINVKVLLEPYYIAICSMENLKSTISVQKRRYR